MTGPLRVGVDARLQGPQGGVASFVIGLASGLSRLEGDDEYLFLTFPGHKSWLRPYLKGRCRMISTRRDPKPSAWRGFVRKHAPVAVEARRRWIRLTGGVVTEIPRSDGSIESEGVEVMHFTAQGGFRTDVPTIYHPHDLQHLHLPQYFTRHDIALREIYYRGLCNQATMIAVSSEWTKNDLITQYGLPVDKIQVVPLAPMLDEYPDPSASDLTTARTRFNLPDAFAFYPAQTWPHKNHMMLLEALALLRREGIIVPLVSSGQRSEFCANIEYRASQLGISDQVQFLGFVTPLELQCLYRLGRCVVIPTKFESASFPLWEAFLAGVPAACSTVTSLPEQASDAALLFDPNRPDEIAKAVRSLWTDETLRDRLVERAHKNVSRLSWERTARIFRAHYRRIAGRALTEEDTRLLNDGHAGRQASKLGMT
jgi:glycosyltransferase involved in cell wall biosynthesis